MQSGFAGGHKVAQNRHGYGVGGTRGLLIGYLMALTTLGCQVPCVRCLGDITGDVLSATHEGHESLVCSCDHGVLGKGCTICGAPH